MPFRSRKGAWLTLAALAAGTRLGAAPPALHTSGSTLCDPAGNPVVLAGLNICSLEWSNAGDHVLESVGQALGRWHAHLIRLPIAQDRWMGKMPDEPDAPNASDGGASYRALVDRIVETASAAGDYVLVDLHWSDLGVWGQNVGQHRMPDDNTAAAWHHIARHFANNPAVLFDAYNEPFQVSWDVWRNGGQVSEKDTTYHSPGMQGLVDIIRGEGANNVIAVGGLDWAFDLRGVGQGFAIAGTNLMYSCHVYPSKDPDWDAAVAPAARIAPVLIGEFGTDPTPGYAAFITRVIGWIQQRRFNGCAWSLHTGAAPCVITDWNYDRSYWDGAYVWSWLHGGPSAPSGLAADGSGRAGIALTWSPVAGAQSYKVYRFVAGKEKDAEPVAAHLAAARFVDTSVPPAEIAYYRVAAVGPRGESGWSEPSGARAGVAGALELPHPEFTFSTSASSAHPSAKDPVTVTATVTNSGADVDNVLVVAGVLDANGNRVESKEFPRQSFAHGETRTFTFSWTPATPGAFRTGAGAFGDGYFPKYGYTLGTPLTVE